MTSFNFIFRPFTATGAGTGRLFIRLIYLSEIKTIATDYILESSEWNEETGTIRIPENGSERYGVLKNIRDGMSRDTEKLESLISEFSLAGKCDADDISRGFKKYLEICKLPVYCEDVCIRLELSGKERTARAYRSAVKSLMCFFYGKPIFLSDIEAGMMKSYEQHLLTKGLSLNTISFYMRQIRALYNRAVREKVIRAQEDNPFADVYTGVYNTRRRALTEGELNSLAALENVIDREMKPDGKEFIFNYKLKKALLLFVFCFHARGMSYVDLAYLKKTDVGRDAIIYKRKKTGKFLEVGITQPMREIIEWFAEEVINSPYVFPIIKPYGGRERIQYESGLRTQNAMLGILSEMAGLSKKVTTHVSRHTWASVAKWRQISVAVISEALGHSDTKVTEHYLASFDQSVLDQLSHQMSAVIKKRKIA